MGDFWACRSLLQGLVGDIVSITVSGGNYPCLKVVSVTDSTLIAVNRGGDVNAFPLTDIERIRY